MKAQPSWPSAEVRNIASAINKGMAGKGHVPHYTGVDHTVWSLCPACGSESLTVSAAEGIFCGQMGKTGVCKPASISMAAQTQRPVASAPAESPSAPSGALGAGVTIDGLPLHTLGEFVARADEHVDWLWNGFVARGAVSLLASKPKGGKTTLLNHLMAAMLEGREFAGRRAKASCVLVLTEEGAGVWRERIAGVIPQHLHERVYVVSKREKVFAGRSWPQIVAFVDRACDQVGVDLVVVDTADKWFGLNGDDDNKTGAVVNAVTPLLQLAEQRRVGVLINTHTRKAEGTHGDEVKGSNALAGIVDIMVTLGRVSGHERRRKLTAYGRYAAIPDVWTIELGDDGYQAVERKDDERAGLEEFARTFTTTAGAQMLSAKEFIEEPGVAMSASTAKGKLERAAELGLLERRGSGTRTDPVRYGLPAVAANSTQANSTTTFTSGVEAAA